MMNLKDMLEEMDVQIRKTESELGESHARLEQMKRERDALRMAIGCEQPQSGPQPEQSEFTPERILDISGTKIDNKMVLDGAPVSSVETGAKPLPRFEHEMAQKDREYVYYREPDYKQPRREQQSVQNPLPYPTPPMDMPVQQAYPQPQKQQSVFKNPFVILMIIIALLIAVALLTNKITFNI